MLRGFFQLKLWKNHSRTCPWNALRCTFLWFCPSTPVLYVLGNEIVKFQVYENDFITADLYKRRECGISTSANGFCGCSAMAIHKALVMWQLCLNNTVLLVLVKCLWKFLKLRQYLVRFLICIWVNLYMKSEKTAGASHLLCNYVSGVFIEWHHSIRTSFLFLCRTSRF